MGERWRRWRLEREARIIENKLTRLDHDYDFAHPDFVGEVVSKRRKQRIGEEMDKLEARIIEIDHYLAFGDRGTTDG